MQLILVTGMSGAGKSVALKSLEDCGFEAIDNMPLSFLPSLVTPNAKGRNLVVGWDIRSRDFSAEHSLHLIEELRSLPDLQFTMLFLDSDEEVLRRRYSETRRKHPLALDRTIIDGIRYERELLAPLRDTADLVIDTSEYEANALRHAITNRFGDAARRLSVVITSFSFKNGLPREADMVFDVRFLRNPHYDPSLKDLTGLDEAVGKYIEDDAHFAPFFNHLIALITPLLPRYMAEGKSYLTIGIGCTGGKHRSVHIAQKLAHMLEQQDYMMTVRHRDIPLKPPTP